MKLQCDNCSHTADYDDFPEAEDFHTRNSIGFLFSDKECPKCGALAFPVPEGAEAERERTRDAALSQDTLTAIHADIRGAIAKAKG